MENGLISILRKGNKKSAGCEICFYLLLYQHAGTHLHFLEITIDFCHEFQTDVKKKKRVVSERNTLLHPPVLLFVV